VSGGPSATAALLRLGREGHSAAAEIFYRALLRWPGGRRGPDEPLLVVDDPWPGDPAAGQAMVEGELSFAGQSFSLAAPNWAPLGAEVPWQRAAHGFAWLRDLKSVGSDAARARARVLVASWIEQEGKSGPLAWQPEVLGARVAAWLGNFRYLVTAADDPLRRRLLDSLALQARHLIRMAPHAADGSPRFTTLKGVFHALYALPQGNAGGRRHTKARAQLGAAIREQVLADGGHIERSPTVQLAVLADLVEIRGLLAVSRSEIPEFLHSAIDRMAPIVRLFRHGDGGLALFNDSNEEEAASIDIVLAHSDAKGKPPSAAPHAGFQRLLGGRTLVLVDCGAPSTIDRHAHAGTLSFEMSIGKERLVVNCGASHADPSEWRRAQRATAAHSTLTLDDTNSSEVLDGVGEHWLGRRPRAVTAQRDEDNGAVWLNMSHDGYEPLFGLSHRRRLFLDPEGEDLRGEEMLVGKLRGDHAPRFAIRFHLHPRVQAALNQQGGALLRLPSGQGWRFRAAGGALELGDSIYLGKRGEMRRSQQLVLRGTVSGGETLIKWALQREGGKKSNSTKETDDGT
jgi:uncharacterized heparinase superfamily protein